jgi:hypothetical protein
MIRMLYYKSLQIKKVCESLKKMLYFDENCIKKYINNHSKYSEICCIIWFL